MDTQLIIFILFLHWFADFFCQTDEMAINKSKDWVILTIHSYTYFVVLCIGIFCYGLYDFNYKPVYLFLNFPAHFIIDAITSRINSRLYENHRHWFFTMIGFDQFLHYVVLFLTIN